jgi:hypothetical protein
MRGIMPLPAPTRASDSRGHYDSSEMRQAYA